MKSLREILRRVASHRVLLLAAALAIAGIGFALLSTRKVITIVVDGGERLEIRTLARTAGGALRSADLDLEEGDRLSPGPEEPISSGDLISLQRATPVLVEVDGDVVQFKTTGRRVVDILAQGGWSIFPGDRVWIDGRLYRFPEEQLASPPMQIRLERGGKFTLDSQGEGEEFRSAAASVAGALWEHGVRLYAGDKLNPVARDRVQEGANVRLTRSRPVMVTADDALFRGRVISTGIAGALLEMGISLGGMDTTAPSPQENIPSTRQFEIVRRTERVLIEQEPLPFETTFQADPNLEIDNQRLLSAGAYGIRARRVRVRFENGEEMDRVQDEEWVIRESEPRVVGYGTDIVVRTTDTPDGTIQYWRAVQMHATSYSPCRIGGDECSQFTATGDRLRKGVAAVFVRWFPYMVGTRVYVPGYGFATILDNGAGGPWARWIDLGYSDSNYEPWSQEVTVYFLTPVPENILYILN